MRNAVQLIPFTQEQHGEWLKAAISQGMDYKEINSPQKYVIYGDTREGYLPVSLLCVLEGEDFYEPHAYIFPWATRRNIYEGAKATLSFLGKSKKVIIVALARSKKLWDRLAKNNVVKFLGEEEISKDVTRYFYLGVV